MGGLRVEGIKADVEQGRGVAFNTTLRALHAGPNCDTFHLISPGIWGQLREFRRLTGRVIEVTNN
jgi:hypothetical protein